MCHDPLFSLAFYFMTVWRRCRHGRFDRCQTRNRLSLWSRAFVNLVITKSFSYVFSLSSRILRLFMIGCTAFSYPIARFRSFPRISAHSVRLAFVCAHSSFGRNFCTSTYNFVLITTISVTLCDTNGSFLFRIRPYFPQWALAHQVRVSRRS